MFFFLRVLYLVCVYFRRNLQATTAQAKLKEEAVSGLGLAIGHII